MTGLSLHPAIDRARLRAAFRDDGMVQIAPLLPERQAVALADHLAGRTDWRMIFNKGQTVYELPRHGSDALAPDQEARVRAALDAQAQEDFQFCFDSVRVPDDRNARRPDDLLHTFAAFMDSTAVLDLLRDITASPDIDFADAQATGYRSGDFLTAHDDAIDGKQRRAAYVFGLTPAWRAEWGGLLLFHDDAADIRHGFVPRFNTLTLFAVPAVHSVSYVTPSAPHPRRSITGWLRHLGSSASA